MNSKILLSIFSVIGIIFIILICIKKKYKLFTHITDYKTDNKIIEDAEKALTNDLLE